MTKIEAMIQLMKDYNGIVTWSIIYNEIEKYYPNAKKSAEWESGLRGVLYRDIKDNNRIMKIDTGTFSLTNYDIRNLIPDNNTDLITDREVFLKIRIAQNKFRDSLLKELKICPITQISDKRILVASHIKPWCLSTSKEKLDINNGFILSPLYDKLFDIGLITFTNDKYLLLSKSLDKRTIINLNLSEKKYELLPVKNREEYLEFHRNKIFIK